MWKFLPSAVVVVLALFLVCQAEESPAPGRIAFEDVTARVQLVIPKPKSKTQPYNCDAAWTDADGDGRLDIMLLSSNTENLANQLFLARPDGTFAAQPPEVVQGGAGLCVTAVDADGDGKEDLFVVGQDSVGDYVLLNDRPGDGTVRYKTLKLRGGSANHYAALGDLNGDGKLDYVITPGGTVGIFDLMTNQPTHAEYPGVGGPVYIADYENDDWPDVLVLGQANHTHVYPQGEKEALYLNHKGEFAEKIMDSGLGKTMSLHGCAVSADFNNDGFFDVLIAGYLPSRVDPTRKVSLFRNNGDGTFTDVSEKSGLPLTGMASWRNNHAVGDFDNDGLVDFVCGGAVWRNKGNFQFEKVQAVRGYRYDAADFDGDGRVDILEVAGNGKDTRILHNTTTDAGHWLKVSLRGPGVNTEAVGARITLYRPGTRTIVGFQQVLKNSCHASFRPHFGLGELKAVDVAVHFPHGKDVEIPGVAADRRISVTFDGKVTPR